MPGGSFQGTLDEHIVFSCMAEPETLLNGLGFRVRDRLEWLGPKRLTSLDPKLGS